MSREIWEPEDDHGMVGVMVASARQILEVQDSGQFIRWMQDEGPASFPEIFNRAPPPTRRSLATALARAIWNATPLPWNGFRPEKLAPPGRNSPCPCGSGRKFKRCCASAPPLEIPEDLQQVIVSDLLPASMLGESGLALGGVDPELLGQVAAHLHEQDLPTRAVKLVEPWLGRLKKLDDRFEQAFDVLWDAYGDLGHGTKKEKALTLVGEAPDGSARAVAWRRRVAIAADQEDWDRAWDCFRRASRDDPDHPSLALSEITLLAAQARGEELRLRAAFWKGHFEALGYPPGLHFMEVLADCAEDPMEAVFAGWSAALPEHSRALCRLTKVASQRPLPAYRAVPEGKANASAGTKELRMEPPEGIRALEQEWDEVTSEGSEIWDLSPWRPELAEKWLAFLEENPDAFDSLEILEDLAESVHEFEIGPLGTEGLLRPLTERGVATAEKALAKHEGARLPPGALGNSTALSLFYLQKEVEARSGDEDAADALRLRILELDPEDQVGVRYELLERLLKAGQDQRALDLMTRFAEGFEAEGPYGRALALFRLGRREEADKALAEAWERLPNVAEALPPARLRKPAGFNPYFVTIGSDAQAWVYRQRMREVWKATPGALAWVKKTVLNARREKTSRG